MNKTEMNSNQSIRGLTEEEGELIDPFILNMDCWLLICKHLTLKDIVNLSRVSTAYKKCVEKYVLPTKYTKLELARLDFFYTNFNDFKFILESIQQTAKELHLQIFTHKEFEVLKRLHFPCVTEMSFLRIRDKDDLCELTRIFPNLHTFVPYCHHNTTSILQPLMLFKHLENLTLTYCGNFDVWEFQDLLIALNLKSLTLDVFDEESIMPLNHQAKTKLSQIYYLTLNSYELNWLSDEDADDVIAYKNLKTLKIIDEFKYFQSIQKLFRDMDSIVDREAYEIEIAYVKNRFLYELMVPEKYDFLNRVNTLKFIKVEITPRIPGAPNRYKALRELYFYYCFTNLSERENITLSMCSNAEELILLSFEECRIPYVPTLQNLQALKVRKMPITLNWYNEKENPKECYQYGGLIKETRKAFFSSNYDEHTMTIKFRS